MSATGREHGFFFNSNDGDRTYDATSMEEWLKPFFATGVFYGDLQVTAGDGMTVNVAPGYANVDGKLRVWDNTSSGVIIETAHATYDRIDTVVVERNDTDRSIFIKVVKGGYSSEPEPMAPVRTGGVYQLVLAEVYVAAGATSITQSVITDKRADTDVCGYVVCPIDTFDFGQFATQFDAYLAEFKEESEEDWTTWAAAEKTAFEAWEAQEKSDYDTWEAARTAAFNTWFAGIQDVLDQDTAGHLLNMINQTRDGILTQTQGKVTVYSGNTETSTWDDGHREVTTYNGSVVTHQMYDHNNTLQWTKTETYNGNTVEEEVDYE